MQEILEEVVPKSCQGYCLLKLFFEMSSGSKRLIMQLKLVEIKKWEWSEKDGDIGWEDALRKWVDEGYAKIFADLYDEDLHIDTLYNLITDKKSSETV